MERIPEPKGAHAEKEPKRLLELSKSPEGLPAIEIRDVSPRVRSLIRGAITANHSDDRAYQLRSKVGAFLQGDSEDWMLIEFWKGSPAEHQAFVDYLNDSIQEGE